MPDYFLKEHRDFDLKGSITYIEKKSNGLFPFQIEMHPFSFYTRLRFFYRFLSISKWEIVSFGFIHFNCFVLDQVKNHLNHPTFSIREEERKNKIPNRFDVLSVNRHSLFKKKNLNSLFFSPLQKFKKKKKDWRNKVSSNVSSTR